MSQQFPTVQDLYNVKTDADDLAAIVNGGESEWVLTRYGGTKPTVANAISAALAQYMGTQTMGDWQSGVAYPRNALWRHDGVWYWVLADYTSGASAQEDIDDGHVRVYLANVSPEQAQRLQALLSAPQSLPIIKQTMADILSASPSETGVFYLCAERLWLPVEVMPEGEVATLWDITFANGRVGRFDIVGQVRVEYFGYPVTDASLHLAMDYALAHDLPLVGGALKTTAPIVLKSGLTFLASSIDNIADSSPDNGIFTGGDFDMPESSVKSYVPLEPLVQGSGQIELTNSADNALFAPGDLVFIRAGSYYLSGGHEVKAVMQLNEITAINGAFLTLAYPIPRSSADAEVTQCNDTAIKDVTVHVGTARASGAITAKLFKQGGGMLRCSLRFALVEADSIFFTNAFTGCTLVADNCRFERHVYELATGSYGNRVHIDYAEMTTPGVAGKRAVRCSESTAFNRVYIGELNMNMATVDSSAALYIEGYHNTIEVDKLVCEHYAGDAVRVITQAFTYTGTPHYIEYNDITIGEIHASNLSNVFSFVDDTEGYNRYNTIRLKRRVVGVPRNWAVKFEGIGNQVEGGYFPGGGLYVHPDSMDEYIRADFADYLYSATAAERRRYYDLTFPKHRALKAYPLRLGYLELISPGGTELTIFESTIASDHLVPGDAIVLKAGGELLGELSNTGTTGVHEVALQINAVDVMVVQFTAGQSGTWLLDTELYFSGITSIQYIAHITDGNPRTLASGVTLDAIDSHPVTVRLVARHASGNNDRFRLRYARTALLTD